MARNSKTMAGTLPGVRIDPDTFVVLSSRLGQPMVAMPKIDPDDPKEEQKYYVPDAWERGESLKKSQLSDGTKKGEKNLQRLLAIGAIGRMDHEEAAAAVKSLQVQRALTARAEAARRGLANQFDDLDLDDDEDDEDETDIEA